MEEKNRLSFNIIEKWKKENLAERTFIIKSIMKLVFQQDVIKRMVQNFLLFNQI